MWLIEVKGFVFLKGDFMIWSLHWGSVLCSVFNLRWYALIEFTESRQNLDPPRMKSIRLVRVNTTDSLQIRGVLNMGFDGFLGAGCGIITDRLDPPQIFSSLNMRSILFLGAGGGELGFSSSVVLSLLDWTSFFFFDIGFW